MPSPWPRHEWDIRGLDRVLSQRIHNHQWPPWDQVLNAWSPAGGTTLGGSRNFRS
jgi:hypothetical protein